MQAPMPPQGSPAPAPEAQAQGGASKLVTGIHEQLMQLMDMLGKSPAAGDDDKQKLGSLIQGYQDFVTGLGAAPGQKPEGPAQPGISPAEAGAADVRPAM